MANSTTNVGVVFTAVNHMTAGVNGVAKDINRLQSTFTAITRAGAAVGGLYGIVSIIKNIGSEAMKQETALNNLSAALGNLGTARTRELGFLTDYAKGLATISTYSTEEIQNEMARAKNMGVVTGQLDEAATAAIGLSKAYRMDLAAAMDLIAKAANGQTAGLKRHGIVLADTMTDQEKYNALLALGYEKFQLATDELSTAAGAYKQTQKAISDTKAAFGEALLPTAQKTFTSLSLWLKTNQDDVKRWGENVANVLSWTARKFLETQDKIVGARADQWIEHTAMERYQIQTGDIAGGGAISQSNGSWAPMSTRQIPFLYPDIYNRIKNQLTQESQDLVGPRVSSGPTMSQISGQYPMPALTGNLPLSLTGAANADVDDQKKQEDALKEAERFARERERIYTRMYKDLKGMNQEAFSFGVELLNAEWDRYEKYVTDKDVLNRWYQQQYRQLEIERMEAGDDWFAGFSAGTMKMQDELKTLGQLGAESAQQMRDAWVDGTMDMIFESKKAGDVARAMLMDFAKFQARAGLNQIYTQGFGAVGDWLGGLGRGSTVPAGDMNPGMAAIAHGGGTIGYDSFPVRRVDPGIFRAAPRLHQGLRSDEFPAILQAGEEVIRKGGGGSNATEQLLRQLIAAVRDGGQPITIVDDRGMVKQEIKHMMDRRTQILR